MFGKIFGKKKEPEQSEAKPSNMEFLGDIKGGGIGVLRFEVGKVLRSFPQVKNAYFSKLKHKDEEKVRIALIVEASGASIELGRNLAEKCAGICDMDLIFSDALNETLVDEIQYSSEPLFSYTNLLFECPILVSWGANVSMPKEWEKAVVVYYVAAPDFKAALNKAVYELRSEGFVYEEVHDGKINQLDPAVWWEKHVMKFWPHHSDDFPSQEHIQVLVDTGGTHKGPALEWRNSVEEM
ncbi:hypothetical protein [Roseovarius rhodophyticola]|uniref:Uncharacterized protein n=1 Tax=Roseovarius rhodophyticola TaxID=3080827 RepID=A0ABZ2TDJ7_9RHOB|nr:hypothetical protein [Roseovarius sp. W115]